MDTEYWTRIHHAIGMGYQVNDKIVILDDLNSDLFIANNNKLIETMMLFNLVNIISKPTRITAHSNTLLDLIIISNTMNYIYEISGIFQILHPNTASGTGCHQPQNVKICPNKIALPLQIIFNKSLQQSKHPTDWKLAHVIAVFKKGDYSLPSNYIHISLISCVGKIMERVIYKHVSL
jgi:hypothetical protein